MLVRDGFFALPACRLKLTRNLDTAWGRMTRPVHRVAGLMVLRLLSERLTLLSEVVGFGFFLLESIVTAEQEEVDVRLSV